MEEDMDGQVEVDEELKGVIAFGNVKMKPTVREQMIAKGIHMRKSKEIKDMLVSETKVPNWVVEGCAAWSRHLPLETDNLSCSTTPPDRSWQRSRKRSSLI